MRKHTNFYLYEYTSCGSPGHKRWAIKDGFMFFFFPCKCKFRKIFLWGVIWLSEGALHKELGLLTSTLKGPIIE